MSTRYPGPPGLPHHAFVRIWTSTPADVTTPPGSIRHRQAWWPGYVDRWILTNHGWVAGFHLDEQRDFVERHIGDRYPEAPSGWLPLDQLRVGDRDFPRPHPVTPVPGYGEIEPWFWPPDPAHDPDDHSDDRQDEDDHGTAMG